MGPTLTTVPCPRAAGAYLHDPLAGEVFGGILHQQG